MKDIANIIIIMSTIGIIYNIIIVAKHQADTIPKRNCMMFYIWFLVFTFVINILTM